MQLAQRLRLPAVLCSVAVLVCALISHPYANMGISDDGPYILMAQTLARTGHVAYNGWAAPMLGWQLYLGAAFIKLFGFSFTTVRMSTLLVAVLMAFVLQRTLVLAGVNGGNATLGTLAFVLSPLYLMLSVTYMSDIFGLFAVVTCLYGCLRALHAPTDGSTILWLCFAVATNAIFGTSRQIAWLGILVMVPSTLFLLCRRGSLGWGGASSSRRLVLLAGSVATLAGALFIFACMQWLKRQPYSIPEHLIVRRGAEFDIFSSFFGAFLELPFLLLPIVALFLPEFHRGGRRSAQVVIAASAAYVLAPLAAHHLRGYFQFPDLLEPTVRDWVTSYGGYMETVPRGARPPVFLGREARAMLTLASLGGLLGLVASFSRPGREPSVAGSRQPIPLQQICMLVAPFVVAYALILVPRASSTAGILDRYLIGPLAVALPWVVRLYQEQVQPRLPRTALLLVAATAAYSVVVVHNMFSFYRARVNLAAELRSNGVPDTSMDNGWEYNLLTELSHSDHVNDPHIEVPSHAYSPVPPLPAGSCGMWYFDRTPHVRPLYGISFSPNACYGPAPFAPVHYSRWPYRTPGTLYVVRYLPPSQLPHGMP